MKSEPTPRKLMNRRRGITMAEYRCVRTVEIHERIAEAARMRAAGLGWDVITTRLGIQRTTLLKGNLEAWNEAYAAAMERAVSEVRQLAGSEAIFGVIGDFLTMAEQADRHCRKQGERLFELPTEAATKGDGAAHTLASFFDRYFRPTILFEASPETVDLYRKCIRKWEFLTGNPLLRDITSETMARFRDSLLKCRRYKRGKISKVTVKMYLKHVQHLIDKAGPPGRRNRDAAGFLRECPWARPPRCEMPEPKIVQERYLSACYEAAAEMDCPDVPDVKPVDWWRALLVLTYNVGLRRRALFKLEWEHVDFADKVLRVPASILKGRRRLILPMNSVVIDHLRRIEGKRPFVFEWNRSREWFGVMFRKLQTSAGLLSDKQFGLHRIRKTCATVLWKHDPAAAQLMLGHTLLAITQVHYVDGVAALAEVTDKLPQPRAFTAS